MFFSHFQKVKKDIFLFFYNFFIENNLNTCKFGVFMGSILSEVWIVIAAFNEEKSIVKVIEDLKSNNFSNIVVVDDGSKDSTFAKAENEGVHLLKHCINRGQGAALQTGIDFALSKEAGIIVTFDADGQHLASEIKDVVKPLSEGFDVVLGSRFLKKNSNVPFFRKCVLKAGTLLCRFFYGLKLTDSHNGFRAFSRSAAESVRITADRMEHGSQILDEIARHNLSYKEVPVTIQYSDYSKNKGQSSLNAVRIFLKMMIDKFFTK
jgi:polyprenyl-phospho-N-acetylgalactosaminyl synthase